MDSSVEVHRLGATQRGRVATLRSEGASQLAVVRPFGDRHRELDLRYPQAVTAILQTASNLRRSVDTLVPQDV